MRPQDIKTIGDVDKYRYEHPVNHPRFGRIINSRYQTLVDLYGKSKADKIIRELEVKSWYFQS